MIRLERLLPILIPVVLICSYASQSTADEARPNILFIAIDDLRPELGCYGATHIHSPNIDRLAAEGRLFERAYCQQSVCNPSRTSLLTGLRPDTVRVTTNHVHFRQNLPDITTLPQFFKQSGYHSVAIGKIYHGVFPDGASKTKWDTMGDSVSWSEPAIRFGPRYYYTEEGISAAKKIYEQAYPSDHATHNDWTRKLVFGPATEAPEIADNALYDGKVAEKAVEKLKVFKDASKPFFLAVGFIKPHSPFIATKKYFDIYSKRIPIPLGQLPAGAPDFAGHSSGELRRYTDQPKKGPFGNLNQQKLRQSYFACVSYIDAQVGRVLEKLHYSGLDENTVVVLWGDHGYHLGEQGLWGKTTNYELDTRVPLIIRTPDMPLAGESTSSIVELVDIYPTLAELSGLEIPKHLEGESFAKILKDPESITKTTAISQFPRGRNLTGYSIRTPLYRLTQWLHRKSGKIQATELYDYNDGPIESINIASRSPSLAKELSEKLAPYIRLTPSQDDVPVSPDK